MGYIKLQDSNLDFQDRKGHRGSWSQADQDYKKTAVKPAAPESSLPPFFSPKGYENQH